MNDTTKKIVICIIYAIMSIVIIALIPNFINYSVSSGINTSFWASGAGKGIVKIIQVVVAIILIIIPIVVLASNGGFGFGGNLTDSKENQGSARKGKVGELQGLTVPVGAKKGGGYTLSKNVRLSAEKSYEHVAIIGPTGAGKSTSFFIPCLLDADGTHSFVVTDPKGELCRLTGPYLESLGMTVIKLDPLDMNGGSDYLYNPVLIAEDFTQIRELAQLILVNGAKTVEIQMGGGGGGGDQATWINMATPLFAAAIAYSKKFGQRKSINEAIDICLNIGDTKKDLEKAEEIFKKDTVAHKNFLIFKSAGGSEKTLSSIKSVLTSNIQLFLDEKVESFVRTPLKIDKATGKKIIDESKLFDPKMLREKPTALFVCVPETKSDYMAPLMSVFYSQLLASNMQYFDKEKYKTPILYLLDEFANIGVIPMIATIAATARSRKLGLSLGLQGVDQLKRNYGEENANNIMNNLKSKVIFSGLTGTNAQFVSDLCGVTTIEVTSKSISKGGGQDFMTNMMGTPQTTTNKQQRVLYTPDEIRRLDENKVLIIAHNRNVVEDAKNVYYKQPRYTKKIKEQ